MCIRDSNKYGASAISLEKVPQEKVERYGIIKGVEIEQDVYQIDELAIGTVYKHMNALAEEGLLHRINESGSPDRYDCTERHDHLICSRCGCLLYTSRCV